MTRQRALRLAREWAQGHMCSIRYGEVAEYHSMFAVMLEEAPPNEPLTLEQLREMDGEPVWVEFEDGSGGLWGIVHITIFAQIVFANGLHCTIGERYYGKSYKAYRRPPEGGDADHA